MREAVRSDRAPAAVGPYSQAIRHGNWIWVSGQIALDPETGRPVAGGIEQQTERVLRNLAAVLEAAGSGLGDVVKTTVFLTDLGDFDAVNRIYGTFFGETPPARACVEVSGLPKGMRVEIEAVAVVS